MMIMIITLLDEKKYGL